MTRRRPFTPVPPVPPSLYPSNEPRGAFSVAESCSWLGCSPEWFASHVAPEISMVRRGRKVLVPLSELERWLGENASREGATGLETPARNGSNPAGGAKSAAPNGHPGRNRGRNRPDSPANGGVSCP
jgi:hypothetical protein